MRSFLGTLAAGLVGIFGALTLEQWLAVAVALLTILSLIPLALVRWVKALRYLKGKSRDPFSDDEP